MSEKRSWDIQPKQKAAPVRPAPAAPRPNSIPRPREVARPQASKQEAPRKVAPVKAPRREKIPQGREREPLKERRRRARRRSFFIFLTFFLLIVIGIFICLWLPTFRVTHVEAAGTDSEGVHTDAIAELVGRDYYIFPRDSIFFFPESAIRARILQQYPDLSAVAISRTSFDSIAIDGVPRTQSFIWCGDSYVPNTSIQKVSSSTAAVVPATQPSCYSVDGQGVLFATIPAGEASSTDTLIAYGSVTSDNNSSDGSLLGSALSQASVIPTTLEFIKILKSLNAAIVTFAIRGDEVDLYTQSGTRITYVLGRESEAKQLAESAFPSLNLNDGSLEYVDLRFDGKVYYKKVGTDAQATSAQ